MELRVAWEDEHLLVVDKPAGVVVHPGRRPPQPARSCTGCWRSTRPAATTTSGPGIVHRLDRDTSGLLVVARSDEAHARLAGADPAPRARSPLPRARQGAAALADRAGSRRRSAATAVDRSRHSLDTATPRERRHALRARRAAARRTRCSTSGSRRGARTRSAFISRRSSFRSRAIPVYGVAGDLGLERQFLHAARLAFQHPLTGERVERSRRCRPTSPRRSSAPGAGQPSL